MTIIPPAPAAIAPAPTRGATIAAAVPDGDVGDLAGAFAALVDAISNELAADEAAPVAEEEEPAVDETTRSALVAALLAASTTPLSTDGSATLPPDLQGVISAADADMVAATIEGEASDLTALNDLATALPTADADPAEADDTVDEGRLEGDIDVDVPAETEVEGPGAVADSETETEVDADADADTALETDAPSDVASVDAEGDGPNETDIDRSAALVDRPTGAVTATAPDSSGAAGPGPAPPTTAPVTSVDGPAAAASSSRTPAPALPDQLVSVLTPLRSGPDGTHRMSLQLRPDELGEVMIDVRVKGNEITLNVRTDLAGTADLVRASLGDLRSQLEAAGFTTGGLDVAGHGPHGTADDGTGDHADAPGPDRTHLPAASADGASTDLPTATSTSGLDLRL